MRLENNLDKILIIDFGSQFTQLIARKVRELNIFCEIISHNKLKDYKTEKNVKGIILSGGPLNVYQNKKVKFNKSILSLNIPVLGICFGHQIISKELGGKVKQAKSREFGLAEVTKLKKSALTQNFFSKKVPLCGVLGGGYNHDPKKLVELHSFLHSSCAKLI